MNDKRQEPFVQPVVPGRFSARPVPVTGEVPPGLHVLELGPKREGLLYAPVGYRATAPAPLVVLLHGAGGNTRHGLALLLPLADAAGLILLAIGGFSDGASYALSVGLTNGDFFTAIIAFSPGVMASVARYGSSCLFLSHGVQDTVLPIDACSRRLTPQLRCAGSEVCYRKFDGPHTVPAAVAREAVTWFTTDSGCGR